MKKGDDEGHPFFSLKPLPPVTGVFFILCLSSFPPYCMQLSIQLSISVSMIIIPLYIPLNHPEMPG